MNAEELYRRVEDVAVAVIPGKEDDKDFWSVYLINLKPDAITNVLINSKGYGEMDDRQVRTGVLRQFFDEIAGKSFVLVEHIDKALFAINNEFWISFWHRDYLYDKKYIFVTDSIVAGNFTPIPLVGRAGVMIV
jgi:hypothetical protein